MQYDPANAVFASVEGFYSATQPNVGVSGAKIIHCINPFPVQPSSEHYRAQNVSVASMTRAREVAKLLSPNLEIDFAKVTLGDEFKSPDIVFDRHATLEKSILDLKSFEIPRPYPLVMDVIEVISLDPSDIFVFTNVDIALSPSFYGFVEAIFNRGADCAIINRRTISGAYCDESDLSLMECEAGEPHPGFDCFAMRGELRDRLLRYEGCVGIGGVMLPLVHQLLAIADMPVVLLDAHATYHLGNDKTWDDDKFSDYTEHNWQEGDRIFAALIEDDETKERLLARLSGAHRDWIFPDRLRKLAGVSEPDEPEPKPTVWQRIGIGRKR